GHRTVVDILPPGDLLEDRTTVVAKLGEALPDLLAQALVLGSRPDASLGLPPFDVEPERGAPRLHGVAPGEAATPVDEHVLDRVPALAKVGGEPLRDPAAEAPACPQAPADGPGQAGEVSRRPGPGIPVARQQVASLPQPNPLIPPEERAELGRVDNVLGAWR